jgi:hypothetical protein
MCYNSHVRGNRGYVPEKRERWQELAEKAEKEQDPKNLLALIIELNKVLAEKNQHTKVSPIPTNL